MEAPLLPMRPRHRQHLRELLPFLLVALLFTFPLLLHPFSHLVGLEEPRGDRAATLWLHRYLSGVITHGLPFPEARAVAFPVGQDLLATFVNLLDALAAQPLIALLGWPWHYNGLVLLVACLNLWGAAALVREFTPSRPVALSLGSLFAFSPPFFYALEHGRVIQAFLAPLPLCLLYLWRVPRESGWRAPILAALWYGVAGLNYTFHAVFLGFFFLLFALWVALDGGWRRAWRRGLLFAVSAALASGVFLVPWLLSKAAGGGLQGVPWGTPFPLPREMLSEANMPTVGVILAQSLPWHWPLWSARSDPGFSAAALLIVLGLAGALLRQRGRWLWVAGALGFYVLSLGPFIHHGDALLQARGWLLPSPAYLLLYRFFPYFSRFHWPYRLAPFALVFLLPLAAALLERLRSAGRRPLWALALPLLLLPELYLEGHWPLASEPFRVPTCYRALARQPPGGLVELPLTFAGRALVYQPFHGRPLVNMVGAAFDRHRWPFAYRAFFHESDVLLYFQALTHPGDAFPDFDAAQMRALNTRGVRFAMYHPSYLQAALQPRLDQPGPDMQAHQRRVRASLEEHLGAPLCEAGDEVLFRLGP